MDPMTAAAPNCTGPSSDADMDGIHMVSKSEIAEERGRLISMRLGVDVQTREMRTTQPHETVLRQDRPISLRVRWVCHLCTADMTSYGVCSECDHARCDNCTRLHEDREVPNESAGRASSTRLQRADDEGSFDDADMVVGGRRRMGGQDLVLRKPRHRVRRTCHVCQTDFFQLSKSCDKCQHVRCTDCPREPAKQSKYPFGYPGDVFGPNSTPYYECAKCWALYPPNTANGTPCKRCGEQKSENSPRAQPRAVKKDQDPNFLQRLEAKLDELEAQRAEASQDKDK